MLIADDDRALCTSLRDILETRQHQVELAHAGNAALAACWEKRYDVLLLDINLPDLSGLELISEVEKIQPELDILIITGNASLDSAVQAVSRSTIGYLVKPVDLDRLLAILDGIAHRKRVAVENEELLESIRQAKQQWESTFHAISDPIVIVAGGDEGQLLRVNQAFCERFKTSLEEAVGAPARELIFGPGSGAPPLADEPAVEERDDLAAWGVFEISSHPLERGSERGMIYVLRDVTRNKAFEAEREALIHQLEDKNTELERYTYTVSHDLKSPLITIAGFLGMLEQSAVAGDLEQVRSDRARIEGAVARMQQLLDELLELSRIGRMVNPPEDVALSHLAQEAIDLVCSPADREVVRFDVAEELPVVRGDRLRLLQVFQNLIDNSIKFMGDQPAPRVEVDARSQKGEVVCFVRDNGGGIHPNHLEKVFGLFDKLDPKSSGTGIGLALVKRIVEVHGGRIWVESEGPGKGTCFCLVLPESSDDTQPPI